MRSQYETSKTLSGLLLGGLLALLGSPLPAHAADRFVNPWVFRGNDANNSCRDSKKPCLTIRRAVTVAASDDTIHLTSWSFLAFGDRDVVVDKNLTFEGLCLDTCPDGRVKLNADEKGRHFDIRAGATVSMSNLELYGGRAPRGGSVTNAGSLTLLNCRMHDNEATNNEGGAVYVADDAHLEVGGSSILDSNSAGSGGAVFNAGGEVTTSLATFLGNHADGHGGAITNAEDGTLSIAQSDFITNSAADGGAITNTGNGTVSITLSHFVSNSAADGGAIADIGTGQVSVTHCLLSDNSANGANGRGGAIYAAPAQGQSTVVTAIDAVTFARNSAGSSGGAIHYQPVDGQLTIVNSTFSGNVSSHDGGAISNSTGNGPVEIVSTTFYGNAADRGAAIFNFRPLEMNNSIVTDSQDLGNNPADACSNLDSITGTGNLVGTESVGVNDRSCNASATFSQGFATKFDPTLRDNLGPKLGAFQAPTLTHALLPGSNAIDSIGTASCLAPDGSQLSADQRDLPRPLSAPAQCDAGAFEWQ